MDDNCSVPSITNLSEPKYLKVKNVIEKTEAQEAFTNLVSLVNSCNKESDRWKIIQHLGTIAQKNPQAIDVLLEILIYGTVFSRYLVAETLSKIAVGNETVITSLVKIIYSSQDKVTINCTTIILGNIAQNRPHAVRALIYLLKNNANLAQKLTIAQKLNQISKGHPQAIIAWLDIIARGKSYAIRRSAVRHLSQVTVGNKVVIEELKKIAHKKGGNQTEIEGKKLARIGLRQIDRSNNLIILTITKLSHSLKQSVATVASLKKTITIIFLQFLSFIAYIIFNPLHKILYILRFRKPFLAKRNRTTK